MDKQTLLKRLKNQGFSAKTLRAFKAVHRENFLSSVLKNRAYEDRALPTGQGQTISQPYTIAMMLDLLKLQKDQNVLEIGSGSGYVLALISSIIGNKGRVYGIELINELSGFSKENTRDYKNVKIYNRNGRVGLPKEAPYDRIIISAAIEQVPEKILEQLKPNGILVAPVGEYGVGQALTVIQRTSKGFKTRKQIRGFVFVRFVE